MLFDCGFQNGLGQVAELMVWSSGLLKYDEINEMTLFNFFIYRKLFKEKFTQDSEQKKKFIEDTFEFARKGIEVICKTVAGAYGTKSGSSSLDKYKK